MSTPKKAPDKRGGLPEDESLNAFAAAAAGAFAAATPTRRRRAPVAGNTVPTEVGPSSESVAVPPVPPVSPVPTPVVESAPMAAAIVLPEGSDRTRGEPKPAGATSTAGAADAAGIEVRVPQLGEAGQDATQCTIMVGSQVRKRFAAYQLAQKLTTGHEPTNAVVVRRAVIHAKKHDLFAALRETVRHRQQPVQEEDFDPDDLFGEVPARRTERGSVKDGRQQSFRPSKQELAVIDVFTTAYGFPNRSDFLNSALDAFLPPLQEHKNRAR